MLKTIYIVSSLFSNINFSKLSLIYIVSLNFVCFNTICKLLNLKQAYDADLTIFNDQFYEICSMLAALDEQGVHTIKTILSVEYNRCTNGKSSPSIKAYNGLSVAGRTLDVENSFKGEFVSNE